MEFDWQAGERPGRERRIVRAVDRRRVRGAPAATLDNSLSAVDFVRLGALSVKAGASGTMYWDEFESRRQDGIGP